jgi:hypothetical protein
MSLDNLRADDLAAVARGVAREEYQLLLGAGCSIGAEGGDGRPLPGANDLTVQILKDFNLNPHGDTVDLRTAYELIEPLFDGHGWGRQAYFRHRFSGCTPSWHDCILGMRWKRIWTLNVDDVIEQAYTKNPQHRKQEPKTYTWATPFCDPNRIKDELQIIHLHGYAAERDTENKLIFSILEYLQATAPHHTWHRIFGDQFPTQPFIVVGAKLRDEWDLADFLRRGSQSRYVTGQPSLIVLREITPLQNQQFRQWGLEPIEADAATFFRDLQRKVKPIEIELGRLIELSENKPIGHYGLIFLQQFQWLRIDADNIDQSNHDFYQGDEPTWADILNDRDAPLEIVGKLLGVLPARPSTISSQMVYCISGYPGSGKTTALFRIARRLINRGFDVYSFRGEERLNVDAVLQWLSHTSSGVLLFDDLADFASDVGRLMVEAANAGLTALVLAAERDSRIPHVYQGIPVEFLRSGPEYQLVKLSNPEIDALLDKLEQAHRLGRLTRDTRTQRKNHFTYKADRQLLVAMAELEGGRGFLGRVRNEFEHDIPNEAFRFLYELCCMTYAFGYPLPVGIACTTAGIRSSELTAGLRAKGQLGSIFRLDTRGLKPRHRVVASMVVERVLDQKKRFEAAYSLAKSLAPYVTPSTIRQQTLPYRIARRLLDKDVVKEWMGIDRARHWYECLTQEYDWNARYWEQRALLEIDFSNFPTARSFAEQALAIQTHTFTENTLGTVLMRTATNYYTPGTRESEAVFWEGVSHLRESRQLGRGRFEHPFLTFFAHTLSYARTAFKGQSVSAEVLHEWDRWRQAARHAAIFQHTENHNRLEELHLQWLSLAVR